LAHSIAKVRPIAGWKGKREDTRVLHGRLVKRAVNLMRDSGSLIEQVTPLS
jgi:hypothetical protein